MQYNKTTKINKYAASFKMNNNWNEIYVYKNKKI